MSPEGRTEAHVIVALIVLVICLASATIYYFGGGFLGGTPAAVAVCALALMGIAASYLILVRR